MYVCMYVCMYESIVGSIIRNLNLSYLHLYAATFENGVMHRHVKNKKYISLGV